MMQVVANVCNITQVLFLTVSHAFYICRIRKGRNFCRLPGFINIFYILFKIAAF